jgi:hypothetical protein
VYESFLAACGFSRYKHHFKAMAQQLPYDRVRQLATQNPALVETALLQIGGLLPDSLPEGTTAAPHFARVRALRRDSLAGLRSLPLAWRRTGVRPNNYPERRLAGAAHVLAATATAGLNETLSRIWQLDMTPVARRKEFEKLFPAPMGFWATHCSWTGKRLDRSTALIGPSRVRSVIGNVFTPAALAHARRTRDRGREQRVFEFFTALPKESENRVLKTMIPRMFGDVRPPKLTFRSQQGLLQIYQDWCEPNPSCVNCAVVPLLDLQYAETQGSSRSQENAGT